MIERRPVLTILSHLVLLLGVLIVAFPVYVTIVASTQTTAQITQAIPMSLVPGDHMLQTYRLALFGGETESGGHISPAWPMMWVSLVTALLISVGKIVISMLSAFAISISDFHFGA